MSSDSDLEKKIVDAKATAPRVTLENFEANIVDIEILKHVTKSGSILRWALITTKNGFVVTGKPSASVSAENDRPAIGEEIAITNAKNELWPLMGYELATKLDNLDVL